MRTSDPLGNAAAILDVLAEHQIRATFFIQSRWARAFPELAKRIVSDGHLVGSHSQSHCLFTALSHEGIADDLVQARDTLAGIVGETRPWFRLPGGKGYLDSEILALIEAAGYRHVHWNAGGTDWHEGITADEVAATAIEQARLESEAIVILHSWPDPTPAALTQIVEALAQDGADFVTVDQLD